VPARQTFGTSSSAGSRILDLCFSEPSAVSAQPSPKPCGEGAHASRSSRGLSSARAARRPIAFPDSWFTQKGRPVVQRPSRFNAFEFAVLSGLRAAQLARGCTPRVICAEKVTVTAQMEIAEGKIVRDLTPLPPQ
ncbi:MAG TPA: hypothetical protein VN654_19895, partial [Vicinamibacterales bacterium]|nr:hypothetical protein [Vicinamibacterales bacterium]